MRLAFIVVSWTALLASGCGKEPVSQADVAQPPKAVAAPTPAQPAPSDVQAPVEPPPRGCVSGEVNNVLAKFDPDFTKLDNKNVTMCGESGASSRACITLDLATGTRTSALLPEDDVAHLPPFPAGFDPEILRDDARSVYRLCLSAEAGCKDLVAGQATSARLDAERKRVVVAMMNNRVRTARVFDTATQAELHQVPIGEGDGLPDCTFARFLGADRLLIATGPCSGPGKSWIVNITTGETVASVGGAPDAFVRTGEVAQVDGDVWAFRSANGVHLWLQNVNTGAVLASVNLDDVLGAPADATAEAWVLASPSEVILVDSRPVVGSVYVLNASDASVKESWVPKPCP